jgi:hypothetical protein
MMSFFPGSTHTPRGRRDAGLPAATQALPAADPPDLQAPDLQAPDRQAQGVQGWPPGTERDDDGGTNGAVVGLAGVTAGTGSPNAGAAIEPEQSSFEGEPVLPPVDEEPFVPKSRYVMGRSTKVLACILLVAAGVFAGSAIQKQIDAGTRGARANFSNFQGTGTATGAGTGTGGTQAPGQSRRSGGSGTGGSGNGGAATGATGAPTAGTGQAASGQ